MAGTHTPRSQNTSSQGSSPPNASPLEQTRQMLDELDSLMERMLALPVNDLESQPPLGPEFIGATVSATMTLLDSPPPAETNGPALQMGMGLDVEAPSVAPVDTPEREIPSYAIPEFSAPETEAPQVSLKEADQLANYLTGAHQATSSAEDVIEPALGLLPDELMPSSILGMSTPPIEPLTMPRWTLMSLGLQPLYWLNRGFDRCTMLLGPIGWLLRHPVGRNTLGITGLAMIGLAVAWLIKDWLGWTW